MPTLEQSILEKARKLKELEREFIQHNYESKEPQGKTEEDEFLKKALEISVEAHKAKNEIQVEFLDISILQIIDPEVKDILDKIRRGDTFYSIRFYERFMEFINKGIENPWEKYDVSLRDFISDYKFDELFDEFHSWFDLVGYYHAKAKIGPIVSASRISNEQVSTYFDEIKEAYAFGQYRSSIALSRALLEMSLFDKLKRKGAFKQSSNKVVSIDVAKEDSLFKFINQAERFGILNHKMASLAHEVRKSANRVLHLKTADPDSDLPENEAFKIIMHTVQILEYVYR